jgi:uncharacterized protein (TIGR02145 family)
MKMGVLYNWAGATDNKNTSDEDQGNTEYGADHVKVRGICPVGWHLPSDMEWSDLEEVIAAAAANIYSTEGASSTTSGFKGATGWRNPLLGRKMKSVDVGGTSKSAATGGFDALFTGHVDNNGRNFFGTRTYFWSSSSYDGSRAWRRDLISSETGVYRYRDSRSFMFPVRCKKD